MRELTLRAWATSKLIFIDSEALYFFQYVEYGGYS